MGSEFESEVHNLKWFISSLKLPTQDFPSYSHAIGLVGVGAIEEVCSDLHQALIPVPSPKRVQSDILSGR